MFKSLISQGFGGENGLYCMRDDELTKEEEALEESFRVNYITYMALRIASNIESIYKYFKNNYGLSFKDVIKDSEDTFVLDTKERELLNDLISLALKEEYKLEVISNDNENLKLREIKLWRKYGKYTNKEKN